MREIEFRGKAIHPNGLEQIVGSWAYGGIFENKIITRNLDMNSHYHGFISEIEIDLKTIGQYTGLKDKNGKKIFEGDIGWEEYGECYGVVKFEDSKFLYLWENIAEDLWEVADDIEICGNIHENLDLLEGK
ncbi:TPA_asm: hypothetical protein GGA54_02560 [Listeria monocytogenes]|uniref:YopX family protein n=1 Tax=Listeria monocytogenes TaxID=1639 RepID=UPI000D7271D3|nr:YopX family protein [Listeria monocytogenes]EAC2253435.1 hypothetical protein [Listeria monocytogenes]PXC20160.1 hypothetical protein C9755_00255 [Listeria monocytogenes]HAA6195682.1 hypothetical protein [Listeria monocytogenes]HAA6201713.1 hypothetical protein [Listeria monocytogenes]